ADRREGKRHGGGCISGSQGCGGALRGDPIRLRTDQFRCKIGKPVELSLRPSIFEGNIATFHVSKLSQSLSGRLDQRLRRRAGLQDAYPPYLPGPLLPARPEPPTDRRANRRPPPTHPDPAPPHP